MFPDSAGLFSGMALMGIPVPVDDCWQEARGIRQEVDFLEILKKLFADATVHFRRVLEKLSGNQLLAEQDFAETKRLMEELCREQERCVKTLGEEGITGLEGQTVDGLAELLHKKEEQKTHMRKLHGMVAEFLSIRPLFDGYQKELGCMQEELASCDDEALVRMEECGELEPYRDFIKCVREIQPDREVVHSLADRFGRELAFALLYHELGFVSGEDSAVLGEGAVVSETDLPVLAADSMIPAEGVAVLSEDVTVPAKSVAGLVQDVTVPAGDVAGLAEDVTVPAKGVVGLAEDVTVPAEGVAGLAEDVVVSAEGIASLAALSEDVTVPAEDVAAPVTDVAVLAEDTAALAASTASSEKAQETPEECGGGLRPLRPVQRRNITQKMLRDGLKGVPVMAQDLLISLSQFGVLSAKLVVWFTSLYQGIKQVDAVMYEGKVEESFQVLLDKGLVAGYRTVEDDIIYCLTEYGYKLVFLKGITGTLGGKESRGKHRRYIFSINNRKVIATEQLEGDVLQFVFQENREMADYLLCLQSLRDKMQCDKDLWTDVLNSFVWEKDHYVVKVPWNGKGIPCHVYHGDNEKIGVEPALFLGNAPSEGPWQTDGMAFFCDKTDLYYWDHGWVLVGESVETGQQEETEAEGETGAEGETETEEETEAKGETEAEEEAAEEKTAAEEETEAFPADPGTEPDARRMAQFLLDQQAPVRMEQLLELTVRLIAENRIAEAATLAETMVKAPNAGKKAEHFYQAFRQSVQMPGSIYQYSSEVIGEQQAALPEDASQLCGLQQTMILATLLWAMAFPSNAYDHNLYNNVKMTVSFNEIQSVQKLITLLSEELKAVSFQNDGLGFSGVVISSLVNNGERERQIKELCEKAAELRPTPTSTVSITGLETCLKKLVGPKSMIGNLLSRVEKNDMGNVSEIRNILERNLGENYLNSDSGLEEYIDQCWGELFRDDPRVKIKHLDNDTTARKQCKKALTDRLKLIEAWVGIVQSEKESKFGQYRENYARIRNQMKTSLFELLEETGSKEGMSVYEAAGRNILHRMAERMLVVLDGQVQAADEKFYYDLCLTPELMLGENGENVVMSELYDVPGMEPWTFVLRAVAEGPESPEQILAQVDNYQAKRWYRNYGSEALLLGYEGKEKPNRTQGIQNAEQEAGRMVETFRGDVRLNRAYGKIQESAMETAFSVLGLAKEFFFYTHNYASFKIFLARLKELLGREVEEQAVRYEKRIRELEADSRFAGAAMLPVIRQALTDRNFNSVDSYINQLQSGIRDIPVNERPMEPKQNFLAQFQDCEKGYYDECQNSVRHRAENPARWGEQALESMGKKYQHWASPNEKKKGCTWLSNWIMMRGDKNNTIRVKNLLAGLGFKVWKVDRVNQDEDAGPMAMYELFEVSAEKTSAGLKDYPHPIYKFGTELSDPMYVVCLYGCKGESTLIHVMTSVLQLNGPTIVLMDGTLTIAGRHRVAEKFKVGTSGQSPFLLIDRVLLLYLASLDEGDRQNAMLYCTLPYTFEVLYGSGSGAVPEEMFIGRISEMNDLRNEQGPSLVYGGRQLGKTALLNRASKTIHDPANRDYSFCVDVKDAGSGVLLEKMNRQLLKLKLFDQPFGSLKEMCEALQEAYEDGKIRKLRVFVDEVDKIFEEFSRHDYEELRPFIVMRDETKHHVKFVFAGTHNVAATESVEEKNSNLLHMGTPLCIEPLSPSDAIKLIRIPMSYLGFEIGDSQIELILSNTNNYPGLIHMFCNALIQSVCRDYEIYYSGNGEKENPPYRISDEQMRAVFKEKDIRREIGTRVMSTIKLDPKYHVISCLLANMTYEDRENGRSRLYGHSAKEILEYNEKETKLPLLMGMAEKDLNALLDEMRRMGILWKKEETGQFRFRQQDFLDYIGTSDQVVGWLLVEGRRVGE